MSQINLTWHGHACFALEADGYRVALDPYEDGAVPGLAPLCITANEVLCSHLHHDHHGLGAVIVPLIYRISPFAVTRIPTFHDDAGGALRGENTIHVLEYDGVRIAHFGDLGHDLSDRQIAQIGHLDAALIPVGGTYTLDCAQADALARRLDVSTVIPMHYRRGPLGYEVLQPLEDFLALRDDVVHAPGNSVAVTKAMPRRTLVLQYRPES